MNLFTDGNDKVGRALVFNLPVRKTCPGSTLFCRSYCYGDWGMNAWPSTRRRHEANYRASLRSDFVTRAVAELRAARRLTDLCRVHSVGDFYDVAYVRKWFDIATVADDVTFWCYTRSWRVSALLPELERLATLENVWLWLSADFMTGPPPDVAWARGVAWMQYTGERLPRLTRGDLVFPLKDEDRAPVKRVGLAMVCPHYSGVPEPPSCEGCGFCFADSPHAAPVAAARRG